MVSASSSVSYWYWSVMLEWSVSVLGFKFIRVFLVITARTGEKRSRNEGKTGRGGAKEARRTPETTGRNPSEAAGGRKEEARRGRARPEETGTPGRALTPALALNRICGSQRWSLEVEKKC